MRRNRLVLAAVFSVVIPTMTTQADDWPQWRGPNRDGIWRETGIITKFDGPEIPIRWKAEIAGGYSGPTVADGRVYVSDRVAKPVQLERVHCFRWTDGEKLWTHEYPCDYGGMSYPAGPRASVTIDDSRAYALGTLGHFVCLDAKSGEPLWKKDPQADFNVEVPTWGIAAAPLVEGDLVILQIGGKNGACVVAMDKKTGEFRWKAIDDLASYCAPIAITQAGRRVVVCRTGERVVGLDATNGEVLWTRDIGRLRWVIAIATPVVSDDRLLLAAVDKGSLMLKLEQDRTDVDELWWRFGPDEKNTDSLQPLMGTPSLDRGYIYGASLYGILRCIDATTGDRLWADESTTSRLRWGNLHIVKNGERHWMFNDQGELIICHLSPDGYEEISRAKLIRPTTGQLRRRDGVTWSHPAYAYKHVFIRNDEELVCASLAAAE